MHDIIFTTVMAWQFSLKWKIGKCWLAICQRLISNIIILLGLKMLLWSIATTKDQHLNSLISCVFSAQKNCLQVGSVRLSLDWKGKRKKRG